VSVQALVLPCVPPLSLRASEQPSDFAASTFVERDAIVEFRDPSRDQGCAQELDDRSAIETHVFSCSLKVALASSWRMPKPRSIRSSTSSAYRHYIHHHRKDPTCDCGIMAE
jgi:hypothetical protein